MRQTGTFLILAGFFGLTGVLLGAFGAHALEESLRERETVYAWETAVRYQFFHTAALFVLAVWLRREPGTLPVRAAGWCWTAGIVLFCGSLYALALGGPGFLGPVTPVGGAFFLLGWGLLIPAAWRNAP